MVDFLAIGDDGTYRETMPLNMLCISNHPFIYETLFDIPLHHFFLIPKTNSISFWCIEYWPARYCLICRADIYILNF